MRFFRSVTGLPMRVKNSALHVAHEAGYGARVSEPVPAESVVGRLAPPLVLPDSAGGSFRLEDHLERGPVVLFFFIHNGTPG
jgi:hypothetical protein